jgi:hypothetical protein
MSHRRNGWVLGALTACLTIVPCASAAAAPTIDNLFTSGGATAGWVKGQDAPGDSDGQALRMSVPSASSYAGADLASLPSSAPASAPSFGFKPTLSGSSAGSPRLVIAFSDGDNIYAMPQTWTAGTWSTVGGAGANWFDAGATACPALADVTYQRALACHVSDHATVTGVDVIADGRGPFVVYIDDIRYAGSTFTAGSAVLAAKSTKTALSTARVSRKTGQGTVGASCGLASGRCKFALTLATRSKGKTVAVGRITGSVAAGRAGLLALKLNSTGRKLLAHKSSVSFIVLGTLPGAGAKNRRTLNVKVS